MYNLAEESIIAAADTGGSEDVAPEMLQATARSVGGHGDCLEDGIGPILPKRPRID